MGANKAKNFQLYIQYVVYSINESIPILQRFVMSCVVID